MQKYSREFPNSRSPAFKSLRIRSSLQAPSRLAGSSLKASISAARVRVSNPAMANAPDPPDESRCTRTGKGWRCHRPRLPGRVHCRTHHLHYLARLDRSRSSRPLPFPSASPSSKADRLAAPSNEARTPQPGQLWALPHEFDALPHAYARVERLFPVEANAEVRLLDPYPSTEDEMRRAEEGLPIACGIFQARDSTEMREISAFSHRVAYMEGKGKGRALGSRPYYRIFPQKGEVWATYHRWDETEKKFMYKLVEIVSGFKEEDGVSVAGLAPVEGEVDLLERQFYEGFGLFRTFSRMELLQFSHRVAVIRMEEGEHGRRWKVLLR